MQVNKKAFFHELAFRLKEVHDTCLKPFSKPKWPNSSRQVIVFAHIDYGSFLEPDDLREVCQTMI